MHTIAAKAVAFGEALQPEFKQYAQQVVKNAAVLADKLQKGGLKLIAGGTSNHLILADVYGSFGIDGKEAQERLERAGITTNANSIPNDPLPPFRPSGLRLGTPALTTRGYREGDMIEIDIPANTINLLVSDEELAKRKAEWKPRQPKITTGYLARYAKLVTSGAQGAVLE